MSFNEHLTEKLTEQVEQINAARIEAYNNSVSYWMEVAQVDFGRGVPVRPFPEVPRKRVVGHDENGVPYDEDSFDLVCESQFELIRAEDGTCTIKTPLSF